MQDLSDKSFFRTLYIVFGSLFAFFVVMVALARAIVY